MKILNRVSTLKHFWQRKIIFFALKALLFTETIVPLSSLRPSQYVSNRPDLTSRSHDVHRGNILAPPYTYDNTMEEESMEKRLSYLREYKQQQLENQNSIDAKNPRDEKGRMKLLASVSRGSISVLFLLLIWRSVQHYQLVDQSFNGQTRLIFFVPSMLLFLCNMVGCIASIIFTTHSHSPKRRLKAIVNLNKIVEITMFIYNVIHLTVYSNKSTQKDLFRGRMLSNFFFIVQCQVFTKVAWGVAQINQDPLLSQYDVRKDFNVDNCSNKNQFYRRHAGENVYLHNNQQQPYGYVRGDESQKYNEGK